MHRHGVLGEHRAGDARARLENTCQQDHDGSGGADQDGVDEHAEGLHEALRGRVVGVRRGDGGDVGGRAHAGLVGKKTALDAIEHGADHTAHGRLKPQGAFDDLGQDGGDFGDVDGHDGYGREQISAGHEGHQDLRHLGHLLDAADDHECCEDGEGKADPQLGNTEGALHRVGDGVGLDGVEDQAEGQDETDREHHAGPARLQAMGQVEGGAAAEVAVHVADLVELGQRALGVAGGHAQQGHHPHPEDRTGPAQVQGHRHTGQVAGANSRRQAGAQGLERRDAAGGRTGALQDQAKKLGEVTELQKPQPQREQDADGQQAIDEDVVPEDAVDEVDQGGHGRVSGAVHGSAHVTGNFRD